jgi:hypothetical protein
MRFLTRIKLHRVELRKRWSVCFHWVDHICGVHYPMGRSRPLFCWERNVETFVMCVSVVCDIGRLLPRCALRNCRLYLNFHSAALSNGGKYKTPQCGTPACKNASRQALPSKRAPLPTNTGNHFIPSCLLQHPTQLKTQHLLCILHILMLWFFHPLKLRHASAHRTSVSVIALHGHQQRRAQGKCQQRHVPHIRPPPLCYHHLPTGLL